MGDSTWTTERVPPDPGAAVVHVHGEDDDALRIVAELADALDHVDRDAKRVCLDPKSSWTKRYKAAAELLDARRTRAGAQRLVIVDPDALPRSLPDEGDARWVDRTFAVARHQVRTLLLTHAASTGGVTFVRPRPEHELTNELGAAGIVSMDDGESPFNELMPFARPLASWLLERGVVSEPAIAHWVRTVDEPDLSRLVVDAAYESLSRDARDALAQLAVLRGPQPLNGVAGPFALDGADPLLSLPASAVDELRRAGWLQPAVGRSGVALPNPLRSFAELRARLTCDLGPIQREIAARAVESLAELGVGETVEAHHHAIDARDAALALKTGRYFVNDLRRLAFELSTRESAFEQAAEIYRAILAADDEDAYAHEYLAYNLDKAQQRRGSVPPTKEILDHYDEARRLERDNNPLFVGRWLACRARRGDSVAAELYRYIVRFHHFGLSAVSFLARSPLRAMADEERAEVARDWRWLLERDDELRKLLP